MIYITFNLSSLPPRSIRPKIFPHDILLILLVVACPTGGLFHLAPTAFPITGGRVFTSGLRNEFHAFSLPLNIFYSILKSCSFKLKLNRGINNLFLTFTFKISTHVMNLKKLKLLVISHHERFDKGEK